MSKKKKISGFFAMVLVLVLLAVAGFYIYKQFFLASIRLKDKNSTFIYIGRDDTFDDVINDINNENIIENTASFEWLAKKMELDKNIHPGKYRILNGMNMRQIINLIKYNKEEKVKLNYNFQIHTLDEFVEYTDDKLALSSSEIEELLANEEMLAKRFKLDPESCFAIIVPGVYEVSWALSADELFSLLEERYNKVWNATRVNLVKKSGYSIQEIITIASIVQSESTIESEQEKIAGVYINRLNCDMPLQADPTLRFANKAFDTQRFWNSDKKINSPYNTYKYKGLPPGPICLVYTQAIDATLNYTKHNYLYFCAKPQLNGYSDFSRNFSQHQKYAQSYQRAMSKRGITR
jgi:UPF0755 protein